MSKNRGAGMPMAVKCDAVTHVFSKLLQQTSGVCLRVYLCVYTR